MPNSKDICCWTYQLERLVVVKKKALDELGLADGGVAKKNDFEVSRALRKLRALRAVRLISRVYMGRSIA